MGKLPGRGNYQEGDMSMLQIEWSISLKIKLQCQENDPLNGLPG